MGTRAPARGRPSQTTNTLPLRSGGLGGASPSRIRGMLQAAGALAHPQTSLQLTVTLMGLAPCGRPLDLLMTDDLMWHVWLFQVCDLFLRQL